ncbi:End3 protein [Saccharomycopsis crataegensis]|uniref:Actin cytoskeleton-regulatory complex protein END3 n=1 Tax=Saccharomycopsis crataegensis TaxID=43959 RepID=A0AAV5QK65_9ASCO|nr:End3 protein [Saccharomycopsis crataegensis]
MPKLENWEIKKFWEIFNGLSPADGKLGGDKVSAVFKNSQLADDKLAKIWSLSDIDQDGNLDFEEFCIAMKLIFDTVNGSMKDLPESLPPWLIPGSKAHLIQANAAVGMGKNIGTSADDDDEDDGYGIRDMNFDWYISPADKTTYENIYNSATDRFGRVKFDGLSSLYDDLDGVPKTDISSAWNLVNPKQFETIDKDQCLVYLHILNQRSKGKKVPSSVPATLRATFSKEVPDYNLQSQQEKMQATAQANKKKGGFGEGYLSKYGSVSEPTKEIDYSDAESVEWEEARLRKKLIELDNKISKTEREIKSKENGGSSTKETSITKYELEQLLKYKEGQLRKLRSNNNDPSHQSLSSLTADVNEIEQQVNVLQQYLQDKQRELSELRQQVQA